MASLPVVYTIQASDAPQHTDRLREILQNLKTGNRISGFSIMGPEVDLISLAKKVVEDDMILIVLTDELETHKVQIEQRFRTLKDTQPGARVAEIIVDNVVYDNEFITFPADLMPIRDREDMDDAWNSIEGSLKDIFPAKPKPANGGTDPVPWKKYLTYAVPVVIIFALIWYFVSGSGPEAHFTFYVDDVEQDTVTACYPPCEILLINESKNYDSFEWTIEDTVFTDRHLRLEFIQPGEKEILLTAFKKRQHDTTSRKLEIKAPPLADFEIRNNGCTAPCRIEFINTTSGASSYSWDFGNGTASEDARPEVSYQSPGEYEVTLIATNIDGVSSEAKKAATIIQDDSPFADFTFSGTRGQLPREVTFANQSQNGDSYFWEFQGGTPATSRSQNPPVITYSSYGEFMVTLTTRKNDRNEHQKVKMVQVSPQIFLPVDAVMQFLESQQNFRQLEIRVPDQNIIRQFEGIELN